MSTHFKVTALKTSSAGGKAKLSKGGKKATKGNAFFGRSLSSARGRGFKGKLRAFSMAGAGKNGVKGRGLSSSYKGVVRAHLAPALDDKNTHPAPVGGFSTKRIKSTGRSVPLGKAVARKKRVQGQVGSSALFVPALSQTAHSPHKKKIVSLYKKTSPHQGMGSKGEKLKAIGKAKGVIHKVSTGPKSLRAGFTTSGKGHLKAVSKGPIAQKFVLKGNIPIDKAQGQGKAKLPKAGKGRVRARGHLKTAEGGTSGKSAHMKRAGGEIKQGMARTGPLEKFTEARAQKKPLKKSVERGPLDKPIDLTHNPPARSVSLKARAEALGGGSILPLKGAPFNKGAVKKSSPALVSSQAVKKAGGKRAGLKKKAVKGQRQVSKTPLKAAFEAQTDNIKGMGEVSEGVRLSEGLPFAIGTPNEKALQGGHGLSLTGGNGKAVFKDPPAIINTSVSIATDRAQARASVLTATPKHDLAGRERELIEKASGGVLLSLRQADKEIVIKLSPEELGRMEIKVKVHHGLVEASILVDNPDVLAMLNANNTALKDQLARQGLMLGGLEVALNRQENSPHDRGELNHGESGRYGRGRQAVKGVVQAGEGTMAVKAPREGGAQGGLDLFI